MVKLAGEAVQKKLKAHYAILHIMSASCLESIADFNRNNFILTWQHGVRTWQMQSEPMRLLSSYKYNHSVYLAFKNV